MIAINAEKYGNVTHGIKMLCHYDQIRCYSQIPENIKISAKRPKQQIIIFKNGQVSQFINGIFSIPLEMPIISNTEESDMTTIRHGD